ncbi:hypothetical protein D1AOALGA4SA_12064 [Olavius algarvensis Delta 1 endosymbiont]|nr:hypothetical protein D1AOALGA4SA_12064 [Olavius algarvensis Delta 1 endosymbiont]
MQKIFATKTPRHEVLTKFFSLCLSGFVANISDFCGLGFEFFHRKRKIK